MIGVIIFGTVILSYVIPFFSYIIYLCIRKVRHMNNTWNPTEAPKTGSNAVGEASILDRITKLEQQLSDLCDLIGVSRDADH